MSEIKIDYQLYYEIDHILFIRCDQQSGIFVAIKKFYKNH